MGWVLRREAPGAGLSTGLWDAVGGVASCGVPGEGYEAIWSRLPDRSSVRASWPSSLHIYPYRLTFPAYRIYRLV